MNFNKSLLSKEIESFSFLLIQKEIMDPIKLMKNQAHFYPKKIHRTQLKNSRAPLIIFFLEF